MVKNFHFETRPYGFAQKKKKRRNRVLCTAVSLVVTMKFSILFSILILFHHLVQWTHADIGLLSFWVPELYALLDLIRSEEGQADVEEHIFGGRKFYVASYMGHRVVAVNTGVGLSNAAATTAILLQKFPSIDRIIGSGIAGGVVRASIVSS